MSGRTRQPLAGVKLKTSLRQGGEVVPAEAFAKGGNSDEQYQESFLKCILLLIYYPIFINSFIVKNHKL